MAVSPSYIEALLRSSLDEAQRRAFKAAFEYLIEQVGNQIDDGVAGVDLSTKADLVHTHVAADVVSGTLDAARIPNLDAAKITTGTIDNARLDGNITHDDVAEMISAAWTFSSAITGTNTPRVHAFHSTTQSIAHNTRTALNFDSEDFDVGALHDNATNNDRITIPAGQGGLYLVMAAAYFSSNSTTGVRFISITKNGGTLALTRAQSNGETQPTALHAVGLFTLAAGDYLQVEAFQNSGANMTIGHLTVRDAQNSFQAVRLW